MSQKINAIVFSSDRAAQLKLFLDSVNKYASDVFDISVIITYTNEEFNNGYKILIHNPDFKNVNFIYVESDFKEQVVSLLKTKHKYCCFFLDDNLFFKNIKLDEITNQIEHDDDVVCFSLRLGENITYCYTLSTENVMHDMKFYDNFMKWDWSLHYLDFGYPLSTEGNVFRMSDISKLVNKSNFSEVEELEMALFELSDMFPRNMMVSYKHSTLVGVPIGRVQESIDNEIAITLKESYAKLLRVEMNNKFLKGNFINLEDIKFSEIIGCHQELNLGVKLKKQKDEK